MRRRTWLMNGDDIQRRVTAQDERGEPIFVGPPLAPCRGPQVRIHLAQPEQQ